MQHPGCFTLRKETLYTFYKRLGGQRGWSGWVWKISPPQRFNPQTVQPTMSCYTDYAIPAHNIWIAVDELQQNSHWRSPVIILIHGVKLKRKILNNILSCNHSTGHSKEPTKARCKIRSNSDFNVVSHSCNPWTAGWSFLCCQCLLIQCNCSYPSYLKTCNLKTHHAMVTKGPTWSTTQKPIFPCSGHHVWFYEHLFRK